MLSGGADSTGITLALSVSVDTPATPSTTRLSEVKVPVLSKQQISTFPANGIRKGSVQKTDNLVSCKREVLTAKLSSMGNSGGTTLVKIRVHSKNSLYRLRLGSLVPSIQRYDDAAMAKHNRKMMKAKVSKLFAVTLEKIHFNSIQQANE